MSMQFSKRKLRLLKLTGCISVLLAVYFFMIALTDTPGDKAHAPWLPSGHADAADYGMGVLVALLTGGAAGAIWLVARTCLSRVEHPSGRRAWRYREMSRREKRRLAAAFMVSSSILGLPFAISDGQGDASSPVSLIFIIAGTIGTLAGWIMVLVQVRPSRTVMQIVEDRLRDRLQEERKQMAREMEDMRESDAREMQRWKEDTTDRLYAMIMAQVNKGVLPCGKCAERDAAHYAPEDEERTAPIPSRSKEPNELCGCGGPASVPVIYFPPRFQSKRTAS